MSLLAICAFGSLLAWFWLLLLRGGFWRCDQLLTGTKPNLEEWPDVVAVIPARDEAASIQQAVTSLLKQSFQGALQIIVVDDNSSDKTAESLRLWRMNGLR